MVFVVVVVTAACARSVVLQMVVEVAGVTAMFLSSLPPMTRHFHSLVNHHQHHHWQPRLDRLSENEGKQLIATTSTHRQLDKSVEKK